MSQIQSQTRILVAEDDPAIVAGLTEYLTQEGFLVESSPTQDGACELLAQTRYAVALVDIGLAQGTGFAVCAAAKEHGVPVIFLTAATDEFTCVAGLDMGADDYISKPFRPRELVSRINSVLRRTGQRCSVLELGDVRVDVAGLDMGADDYISKPFRPRELVSRINSVLRRTGQRCSVLELGDVRVDVARGVATKAGRELYLSALEYRLLLTFMNARGCLLTRAQLADAIWDAAGAYVEDNTLSVYIKRLRDKIEDDPSDPRLITTVRGIGYRVAE